jgi:hypothetical protein
LLVIPKFEGQSFESLAGGDRGDPCQIGHAKDVAWFLKMRRVLRALRAHSKQTMIRYPTTNGNFLRFSEVWLRSSFSDLMQTVWQEFPK